MALTALVVLLLAAFVAWPDSPGVCERCERVVAVRSGFRDARHSITGSDALEWHKKYTANTATYVALKRAAGVCSCPRRDSSFTVTALRGHVDPAITVQRGAAALQRALNSAGVK